MKKLSVIFAAVLVAASVLAGCQPGASGTTSTTLATVEVTEYQGQKLSSVHDFHENSIEGPQYVDVASYHLKISGLVAQPQEMTYDAVLGLPAYQKVITLNCVEGWSVTILWEGVRLQELLQSAQVSSEANTVIFHAYDGYTSSLPLDYLLSNNILVAYRQNGNPLAPERGYPFQVAAEAKWGYKWVKWITEIELSNDPEYKGYWESRGYSIDGSLDRSFQQNAFPFPLPGF
jgi:DMSO/TMAO reductase YedYZ molybdopterin-dependent catalytic subunit